MDYYKMHLSHWNVNWIFWTSQKKKNKSIFQSLTDLEGPVKTAQPTVPNKTNQILLV